MKRLSYHYIYRLLMLPVAMISFIGCQMEDGRLSAEGSAAIRLEIPQLETISRVPVTGNEDAINHLRVIILSQNSKESINRTFNAADLATGSVVIENVPVGKVQMYVIANESSLGRNYDDLKNLQNELEPATNKVLIKDETRSHFPKRGSQFPVGGLPMTWMDNDLTILPPSGTLQNVEVFLVRAVAKLNIQMSNMLTDRIVIDEMSFGPFFGDRLYLFAEGILDVPEGNVYAEQKFTGLNIPIDGQKTEQLVLYIYPSWAWEDPNLNSPYTIGFHTEAGGSYPQMAFVKEGSAINSIPRNKQINIYATLSAPANVNIDFEVLPWEPKNIDVPPFN